ncbi:MAG TPA: glycoside hydrolase family 28 protein, partial [Gemmatimonadaceae bacterium]|nr:glycoside hydrolase family 28 protein [Gemmatimonadaceae bacterium]
MMQRREFLRRLGAGIAIAAPLGALTCRLDPLGPPRTGWDLLPDILARIVPPSFPDRTFDITQFGAEAGGTVDCTDAIRRAIAACTAAGGGKVVVPPGTFLTGAIHLDNNVNLYVSTGATLLFNPDPTAYLPVVLTRYESTELMNYSPFIYAYGKQNIAVTGGGTLDGQASTAHWWPWTGRVVFGWQSGMPDFNAAHERLLTMAEQGVPVEQRVFGDGSYLRPNFVQPYNCKNVLIENITIINSPMWEINPTLCQNVTVRGVKINSHGPNNDGVDPDACRDVLIESCTFSTGDDCVAIKSGRNADGRRINVPSENIVVRNCDMGDGHGGVTVGSEISAGAWNVFAYNCSMNSPYLYSALRIKNNAMRGGDLHDIYMRDITVGQVGQAIMIIDFYYDEAQNGPYTPQAHNIEMKN